MSSVSAEELYLIAQFRMQDRVVAVLHSAGEYQAARVKLVAAIADHEQAGAAAAAAEALADRLPERLGLGEATRRALKLAEQRLAEAQAEMAETSERFCDMAGDAAEPLVAAMEATEWRANRQALRAALD